MKKNWDRAAMRFSSAKYIDRQSMVEVTFENGDHFLIATESILPAENFVSFRRPGSRGSNPVSLPPPEWAKMRISETGDVLEVPANDAVIEIPWDRLRSLVDPEFRAHLADQANERAQRIGGQIRAMRLATGLTPAALAEKIGVPQQVVAHLEDGKMEPRMDLLEHIAVVLGRRLRDFAKE